ncbi:hypothetical protein DPMN_121406 [Dreissena polymorpha]|uniref:Uncharacterized protein n=1 Tax=Dreissena polymorpha TaxID=45954 RepID=A0A9D4JR19_DREPO|nr:hypothetical protein DPMN_121406 [Dreissena polymorpha]
MRPKRGPMPSTNPPASVKLLASAPVNLLASASVKLLASASVKLLTSNVMKSTLQETGTLQPGQHRLILP